MGHDVIEEKYINKPTKLWCDVYQNKARECYHHKIDYFPITATMFYSSCTTVMCQSSYFYSFKNIKLSIYLCHIFYPSIES